MKASLTFVTCPFMVKVANFEAIQKVILGTVYNRAQRLPEVMVSYFGYFLAPFGCEYALLSANTLSPR